MDEFVKSEEEKIEEEVVNQNEVDTEFEKVKEELTSLENKYKRALADYQNLQKRTLQEKEELYKYASQKTIEMLIPALDILNYAKSSLNVESGIEKIIKDVDLICETFLKSFKEIGITVIEETGVPFDPFSHEVLQQIPTNELPPHTVMQILKKGYMLNGKVIRPALVSVSTEEIRQP